MKTIDEIHDDAWWSLFKLFSRLRPVEAHSAYPKEFYEYIRTIDPDLSDATIAYMIAEVENENKDEK